MMKPYPSYKDNGVAWIGEIPRYWDTIRCGYLFKVKSIKNTKNEVNLSVYRDYGVILRDSRDDNYNRVSDDTSNYKLVEIGDFVFNKMKCWMGSLGVSEYRGIVSPSYTVCETTREFDRKYIHYLLRSTYYIQEYEKHSYGVRIGQWELHFHDFKNIVSLFPPLTEQKKIVSFLDHKTQKIDELIEKTEKKIELLKEKRTSLINHCVTKGLNPDVEMKDSGVEWIGEIPRHWEMISLKYLTKKNGIVRGPFGSSLKIEFFVESGFKVYEQKNAIYKDITLGHYFIDENKFRELERFSIQENDLIISCSGTIGKIFIIPKNFILGVINQALLKLTLTERMSIEYFSYLFESYTYENLIIDKTQGGAMKNLVGIDTFKSLKFVVPPYSEQDEISEFLNKKTLEIDQLNEKEAQRIELLKEYRQSLISEVVTGKIDVRYEVVV